MCLDPGTLAIASTVASVGSAAAGAYGSFQSARGEKKSRRYQAAVDKQNAKLAEWKAADAIDRGKKAEQIHRIKAKSFAEGQVARLAANGFQVGAGDEALLLADTAEATELDARTIRNNAQREAFAFKVQSQGFQAQASQQLQAADNVSYLGAFGQAIAGAGRVADKWYKYSADGHFRSKAPPAKTVSFT